MSFSFLSQVESDPQKLVVFIWDFQIKDTLHSSGIVKLLLEYDGDDPFPTMPWLVKCVVTVQTIQCLVKFCKTTIQIFYPNRVQKKGGRWPPNCDGYTHTIVYSNFVVDCLHCA